MKSLLSILQEAERAFETETAATDALASEIRLEIIKVLRRAATRGSESSVIAAMITTSGLMEATAFAMTEAKVGTAGFLESMIVHARLCGAVHTAVKRGLATGQAVKWEKMV